MTHRVRADGFTLIEMIIVIVVLGAISAVGGLILGRAFESYLLTQDTTDVDWQGRVALERMARDLREIRAATATDLTFAANPMNEIRFVDVDGNVACFRLTGTTLQRSADGPAGTCGATNAQPLANNVVAGGLNIYYYAVDGTAPLAVADVYYVVVSLSISQGGVSETYRVTVRPRRF